MRSTLTWLSRKRPCARARQRGSLHGIALRWLVAVAAFGACGGGPHTLITARHTPCKPRDISISELTYTGFGEDWLASCGKLQFRCRTREEGHRLVYSCRRVAALSPDGGVAAADATTSALNPATAQTDAGAAPAASPEAGSLPEAGATP